MQKFLNNFISTFLDPVPGTSAQRQVRVARDAGGAFDAPMPAGDFVKLTAFRVVNGREVDHEVMTVVAAQAVDGVYLLTIERAQEKVGSATSAIAHEFGVGDFLEARLTAGAAQSLLQAEDNLRTLGDADEALENLGAGTTGTAVLKAGTAAEARLILGVGTGGGGSGTVDVAEDGSLVAGGQTVAPAYLGVRTASQITAIHDAIVAGTATYPGGSELITEAGEVLTLRGVGTAARFTPTSSSEIKVQPIRSGASTLVQGDAGSVIPVSGAATITVPLGLTGFSAQLLRHDAGALTVQPAAGVKLFHGAAGEVSSLSVTLKSQWILLMPGAAPNEFYLSRYVGA